MVKLRILAILLALVTAFCAVAYIVTRKAEAPAPAEEEEKVYSYSASEYGSAAPFADESGKIYLPAGIDGYYYTADLKNNIEFYQYTSAGFLAAAPEVKTASVKLSASGQSIPVKVRYISVDGVNTGVGVFTADMDKSVKYYDYAFVHLIKKPEGYGGGYLLLADYTKEDFYKTDKVYNDIFEYDMKASSVSLKLSQNTRLIDSNATYKQSWDMMTDEFAANIGKLKYFLSSRYYTEAEMCKRTDVMTYSGDYRPGIAVKDIVGTWFVSDDAGNHYIKADGDGFKAVTAKDGKSAKEIKFDGDYFTGYLRSGNWLFNKSSGEAVNLLTGDSAKFTGADFASADVFSISPDGGKAVIAFNAENNENGVPVQTVVYCEAGASSAQSYSEPLLFCEESSFVWLDNNSVMSARPTDENGSGAVSVIYTFTTAA